MFVYKKYLSDIFQWVKKSFPTQQPCLRLKRYVEIIKAAIIGYMSLINIHYGSGGIYLTGTLNAMILPSDHTFHSQLFTDRNQVLSFTT